jgi:2-keto-4-pentenoate hydratase/2-oxohepta-3-ene-1,7-dioic acid hydratase in catechol pathway
MKLYTLTNGRQDCLGIERDGELCRWVSGPLASISLVDVLTPEGQEQVVSEVAHATLAGPAFRPLSPIPFPRRNLMCLGKNYAAHASEFDRHSGGDLDAVPAHPIVFTKAPTAICGPGDVVEIDARLAGELDYEGELAVVIGVPGRSIPLTSAFDHVAGYTIVNDVTARDLQRAHNQWFLSKSIDRASGLGPCVVTADELADVGSLELRTWVDGELRQEAVVKEMIFSIPEIIHTISQVLTLEVGDIIATGTPEGVAIGFDPPRFLEDGSVVVIDIDQIGRLENTFRFTASEETSSDGR